MATPPARPTLVRLHVLVPAFFAYVLSFLYVGIYWTNHHHLLHASEHVSGGVLWANLHLLFWLTLIPFVTDWIGETHFATWPVAAYGLVLFMCGVAWQVLRTVLVRFHGMDSMLGTRAPQPGQGADLRNALRAGNRHDPRGPLARERALGQPRRACHVHHRRRDVDHPGPPDRAAAEENSAAASALGLTRAAASARVR